MNSKKTKIILGVLLGTAIATGVAVTAVYLGTRPKTNKIVEKSKYPDLGIKKADEDKAKKYDAGKNEEMGLLKEYIDKVLNSLDNGTKNVPNAKTLEEYKKAEKYLGEALEFGKSAKEILKKAQEKLSSESQSSKDIIELKNKLEKSLNNANTTKEILNKKLLLKKEIKEFEKKVDNSIKNIDGAIILPEVIAKITEFDKLLEDLNKLKHKIEPLKLDEEKSNISKIEEKLNQALKTLNEKKKLLENNIEAQKNAIKDYFNRFKEKVKVAIEKSKTSSDLDEMKNSEKVLRELSELGKKIHDQAETLGLIEEKTKYNEQIKSIEDELVNLLAKIHEKTIKIESIKLEIFGAIKEMKEAIEASNNSRNEASLTASITKLESALAKSEDIKTKAQTEKLPKEEIDKVVTIIQDGMLALEIANKNAKTRKEINNLSSSLTNESNALKNVISNEKIKSIIESKGRVTKLISEAKELIRKNEGNLVIEMDLSALKNIVKIAEKHSEEAKNKIEFFETIKANLLKKIAELIKNLSEANEKAVQALKENNKDSLEKVKDELTTKINETRDIETEAKKLELDKSIEELKIKLDLAIKTRDQISKKIEDMELSDLASKKTKINEIITKLTDNIAKANDALKSENKYDLNKAKIAMDEILKSIYNAKRLRDRFAKDHNDFSTEYNSMIEKLIEAEPLEEKIKNLIKIIENKRQEIDLKIIIAKKTNQKILDNLNKKPINLDELNQLKLENSDNKKKIDEIDSQINELKYDEIKVPSFEKIKNDNLELKKNIENKINEYKEQINKTKLALNNAEKQLQEGYVLTKGHIGTLKLFGPKGSIEFYKQKIVLAKSEINNNEQYKNYSSEVSKALESLKIEIETAEKTIIELENSLPKIKSEIDKTLEEFNEFVKTNLINKYNEPLKEILDEITKYDNLIHEIDDFKLKLTEFLTKIIGENKYKETEIKALNEKINEYESKIKDRHIDLFKLKKVVVEITNKNKHASDVTISDTEFKNKVDGFNLEIIAESFSPNDIEGKLNLRIKITGKFEAYFNYESIDGFIKIDFPSEGRIKKEKYFDFIRFVYNNISSDKSTKSFNNKLYYFFSSENFKEIRKKYFEYKVNSNKYLGFDSYIFKESKNQENTTVEENTDPKTSLKFIKIRENQLSVSILAGKDAKGNEIKTTKKVDVVFENIIVDTFKSIALYFNSFYLIEKIYTIASKKQDSLNNKIKEFQLKIKTAVDKTYDIHFVDDLELKSTYLDLKNQLFEDYKNFTNLQKEDIKQEITDEYKKLEHIDLGILL